MLKYVAQTRNVQPSADGHHGESLSGHGAPSFGIKLNNSADLKSSMWLVPGSVAAAQEVEEVIEGKVV